MKTIFILFNENCGSSWLLELLGAFDDIAAIDFEPINYIISKYFNDDLIEEYFNTLLPEVNQENLINFRRKIGLPEISPEKNLKFCNSSFYIIKIRGNEFYKKYQEQSVKHECRLIYLVREDFLKNAFSAYKRRVIGVSHFDSFDITPGVAVEKENFLKIANEIHRLNEINSDIYLRWSGKKMIVSYESLLENKIKTLDEIGDFLKVKFIDSDGYYKKITNDDLSITIKNFDEVQRWFISQFDQRHIEESLFYRIKKELLNK